MNNLIGNQINHLEGFYKKEITPASDNVNNNGDTS